MEYNRREFLKTSGMIAGGILLNPLEVLAQDTEILKYFPKTNNQYLQAIPKSETGFKTPHILTRKELNDFFKKEGQIEGLEQRAVGVYNVKPVSENGQNVKSIIEVLNFNSKEKLKLYLKKELGRLEGYYVILEKDNLMLMNIKENYINSQERMMNFMKFNLEMWKKPEASILERGIYTKEKLINDWSNYLE